MGMLVQAHHPFGTTCGWRHMPGARDEGAKTSLRCWVCGGGAKGIILGCGVAQRNIVGGHSVDDLADALSRKCRTCCGIGGKYLVHLGGCSGRLVYRRSMIDESRVAGPRSDRGVDVFARNWPSGLGFCRFRHDIGCGCRLGDRGPIWPCSGRPARDPQHRFSRPTSRRKHDFTLNSEP